MLPKRAQRKEDQQAELEDISLEDHPVYRALHDHVTDHVIPILSEEEIRLSGPLAGEEREKIEQRRAILRETISEINGALSRIRANPLMTIKAAKKALEDPINANLPQLDKHSGHAFNANWGKKLARAVLNAISAFKFFAPLINKVFSGTDAHFFSPPGETYDTAKKARDALRQGPVNEKKPAAPKKP